MLTQTTSGVVQVALAPMALVLAAALQSSPQAPQKKERPLLQVSPVAHVGGGTIVGAGAPASPTGVPASTSATTPASAPAQSPVQNPWSVVAVEDSRQSSPATQNAAPEVGRSVVQAAPVAAVPVGWQRPSARMLPCVAPLKALGRQ